MEVKGYAKYLRRSSRVNDILPEYQETHISLGDEVKEDFRDLIP